GVHDKAIDMLPRLITTLTKQAESSGLRMADEFYPEIDEQELEELKMAAAERAAQPDPKVIEAEKKIELQAMEGQAKLALEREKMAGDMQLKRDQLVQELLLKREQLAAELALKRELSLMEMDAKERNGFY